MAAAHTCGRGLPSRMPLLSRPLLVTVITAFLIRHEDRIARGAALLSTASILWLLARVLLDVPAPAQPADRHEDAGIEVRLLARELPSLQTSPPVQPLPPGPRAATAESAPPAQVRSEAPDPLAAPPQPRTRVYTRDGGVAIGEVVDPLDDGAAVPPGMEDPRALAQARRVLERPNPVQYQGTRFEKDWKSDGTLGDVAVQGLNRGMKSINRAIFGDDVQQAVARPPPDVRFNPALAENRADLGSEATGDAYKAAPIAHETLPTPSGEATRRIRERLAALERQPSACGARQRQALLTPARTHLQDLQRAETALAKGADPVQAQQLLPRQADSAYDLARRALWYAERGLGACSAGG